MARGRSDIDVTLFRGRGCRFDWEVKNEWSVSDHNPIKIRIKVEERLERTDSGRVKAWYLKEGEWRMYRSSIGSFASAYGYEKYRDLGAEEKIAVMYQWIEALNDSLMKRACGSRAESVG